MTPMISQVSMPRWDGELAQVVQVVLTASQSDMNAKEKIVTEATVRYYGVHAQMCVMI